MSEAWPRRDIRLEYETERVAFARAAITVPMPPATAHLEGGPLDGYEHVFDLLPDIIFVGEEGTYRPTIPATEPWVFVWMPDAPTVWSGDLPPGGYVCGTCGMPVESEPCPEHQPAAPQ